ncbi:cryptochrome/photolyase family protein [Cecembia calidifontis]|jgi:deoxyribodipyrimidine photolyase-related protein|uniref:Deoxyribodipyrimidine photolyase-related protein n=1 Tax=Cecembia calidifontis TaxID=1187080 RepID=A0A4Q7P5F6_9BACT|nr:cryptochrome/photolyase family protein [Cecembia calidifontis]RZS95155.1 deoxyribodipyrimidine photolyase-related protein [Cecembia calidifontis]
MPKTLRLILGDQLNRNHSWFKDKSNDKLYVMMEIRQETDYVRHHIQKVIAFFMAMRSLADHLKNHGHKVLYIGLDHPANQQDLVKNLSWIIREEKIALFEYQLPDEYRLDKQLKDFCLQSGVQARAYDTEHFLSERDFLENFFKGKKTYLMESFYREMRKKYDILMDGKEPLTGRWNYDQENRNKFKDPLLLVPPKRHQKDVSELLRMIQIQGIQTIGSIDDNHIDWPVSREESLELVEHFCQFLLPYFGMYQDAMFSGDPFLFHSRLSFSLNTKMISPLEVVQKVEGYWLQNQDKIGIAQAEGFIRQIIGWREYMRGVYWAKMPEYAKMNYFGHDRKLPDFFWTGKTKMNCLKQAIGQSLEKAYAHHIQRLMVTGNFALLSGIDPDEVDKWYLGIYIDAIEWVEITNTRGMSQFADGGIVGTKPYVSSANYIDKMSDYCGSCYYDKLKKTGHKACPFNSLYWHFYNRNEEKLGKNPRIGMMYRTLAKMKDKKDILEQAEVYLSKLEDL